MTGKKVNYTSESIDTLRFPESIRKNVSLYLGSSDAHGRWVIAREILDNALDEALAGRNRLIQFFECADGSYCIADAGGGIPQGQKEFTITVNGKVLKERMPTMQAVFSELHTSGKFRSDAYARSIGTHGCGVKATNATSEFFRCFTFFEKAWYCVEFHQGKMTRPVSRSVLAPRLPNGVPASKGTVIFFKPDAEIFGASDIDLSFVHEWSEITSFMTPGLEVSVIDKTGAKTVYQSKSGAVEFVDRMLAKTGANAEQQKFESHDEFSDVVIAFSNADGMGIRGYTNGLLNAQGGRHVDSVLSALTSALKEFAKKKQTVGVHDVREGLLGIVNIKIHKPEFSSQDKSYLSDSRAGVEFAQALTEKFRRFFASNKALAQRLCEKATKLSSLRMQFKASKKVIQALNTAKKKGMPSKYAPYDARTKVSEREALIVEGESASGGLRETRTPNQALIPLRGKIQNCAKSGDKALESEEIIMILSAIGFDPKAENPASHLQVGKIICLADPDPDGSHINTLLLTLFFTFVPEVFERGMVYVADIPELYAQWNGHLILGDSLDEVHEKLQALGAPKSITAHHIKGWGEIDASLMHALAVDPKTRKLIKIKPLTDQDRLEFASCMNDDVEFRRKMLNLP